MATGYRLLDQPNPNYPQWGNPRRNGRKVTGGIILHSAEGGTDLTGPDTAAENVARYLTTRTTPGSYHILVDRDSILPMVPFDYEAWHDTTSNNYTVGISVAWNKADLPRMTRAQRDEYYRTFARAVLDMVAWFKRVKGITVPVDRFISRADILAGKPGLSTHSRMDPGRRSDPFGTDSTYEAEFLSVLADLADTPDPTPATPTPERQRTMRVIRGIEKPEVYVTDGTKKRHIVTDGGELADTLRLTGQSEPDVIGQFTADRIPLDTGGISEAHVRKAVTDAVAGLATPDVDEQEIVDGITAALIGGLEVKSTLTAKEA